MTSGLPANQRGATLIIGLIMVALVSVIVVGAFSVSSSNLKSVGNMQVRNEGLAAANQAIELVVGSTFTNAPQAQSINVDINKDNQTDFVVALAKPECIRALKASESAPSDVELPADLASGATWNTEWEIDATVTDAASGASVQVRQGIRVLLSNTQKELVCL